VTDAADESPVAVVATNGVDLCTQSFGDPGDPAILLIAGAGASMLWWDEDFCRRLAAAGRLVIRYDQRDTGRSTTFPPGNPGYSVADLVADATGVLDGYGLPAANLVGFSAGGAITQLLALHRAERVRSLTLVSTTAVAPVGQPLPPPVEAFRRFLATARIDWSDRESVIRFLVDRCRVLAGRRPFDEAAVLAFVRRDVERARDPAALRNHDLIADGGFPSRSLSSITVPTLVIHGLADPVYPSPHDTALTEAIPTAGLHSLIDAGHGFDRTDWDEMIRAIRTFTDPEGLPRDPRMDYW